MGMTVTLSVVILGVLQTTDTQEALTSVTYMVMWAFAGCRTGIRITLFHTILFSVVYVVLW